MEGSLPLKSGREGTYANSLSEGAFLPAQEHVGRSFQLPCHREPEAKAELSEPAVQPPTPTHDDLSTEAGTDAVRDTTEQAKSTQEADKIEINVHNSS